MDAMAELTTITPRTREALANHIRKAYVPFVLQFDAEELIVEHYGYDDREGWDAETYIVWIDRRDMGVLGFIDQEVA